MDRIKKKRISLLCTGIMIMIFCINAVSVRAAEAEGRVLFISSYSYGWPAVQAQIEGIEEVKPADVVLDYEFMNTKQVDDEISRQQFYEGLSYRLSQVEPYDVVILGDDAALLFAASHREELFEGIPLVYEGVNDEELAKELSKEPLITGIVEKLSIENNIDFGLTLYPSAKKVVAILDDSVTGDAERKSFYSCAEQYPDLEFSEINPSSLTTNQLRLQIGKAGEDTILIYITMTKDASGRVYSDEEGVQFVTEYAKIPVLRMVESGIGNGLLGGNVVSMHKSGELAMGIAVDILKGTPSGSIEAISDSPNMYYIDEQVMKKFGLSPSLIPEGAVVINHQPGFWERNREVLFPVGIVFAALLVVILFVLFDNIKRRKLMAELKEARNIMESASQHDFLTGLPNRSKFMIDLENTLAEGKPFTIMMLDIDHFKHINDNYGHTAGDEALKQLAGRLKGMHTQLLTPYRYAGDEFIIILKSGQKKIIEKQAFQCSQLFSKPFILAGEKKQVGGSIGVASYPSDADDLERLINCADEAMYQVKKHGRNHYILYSTIGSED